MTSSMPILFGSSSAAEQDSEAGAGQPGQTNSGTNPGDPMSSVLPAQSTRSTTGNGEYCTRQPVETTTRAVVAVAAGSQKTQDGTEEASRSKQTEKRKRPTEETSVQRKACKTMQSDSRLQSEMEEHHKNVTVLVRQIREERAEDVEALTVRIEKREEEKTRESKTKKEREKQQQELIEDIVKECSNNQMTFECLGKILEEDAQHIAALHEDKRRLDMQLQTSREENHFKDQLLENMRLQTEHLEKREQEQKEEAMQMQLELRKHKGDNDKYVQYMQNFEVKSILNREDEEKQNMKKRLEELAEAKDKSVRDIEKMQLQIDTLGDELGKTKAECTQWRLQTQKSEEKCRMEKVTAEVKYDMVRGIQQESAKRLECAQLEIRTLKEQVQKGKETQQQKREQLKELIEKQQKIIECSICLEPFNQSVTLECGHSFCLACINRAERCKKATCPMCRQLIGRLKCKTAIINDFVEVTHDLQAGLQREEEE